MNGRQSSDCKGAPCYLHSLAERPCVVVRGRGEERENRLLDVPAQLRLQTPDQVLQTNTESLSVGSAHRYMSCMHGRVSIFMNSVQVHVCKAVCAARETSDPNERGRFACGDYIIRTHLSVHGLVEAFDLLTLPVASITDDVNDRLFISSCWTGKDTSEQEPQLSLE